MKEGRTTTSIVCCALVLVVFVVLFASAAGNAVGKMQNALEQNDLFDITLPGNVQAAYDEFKGHMGGETLAAFALMNENPTQEDFEQLAGGLQPSDLEDLSRAGSDEQRGLLNEEIVKQDNAGFSDVDGSLNGFVYEGGTDEFRRESDGTTFKVEALNEFDSIRESDDGGFTLTRGSNSVELMPGQTLERAVFDGTTNTVDIKNYQPNSGGSYDLSLNLGTDGKVAQSADGTVSFTDGSKVQATVTTPGGDTAGVFTRDTTATTPGSLNGEAVSSFTVVDAGSAELSNINVQYGSGESARVFATQESGVLVKSIDGVGSVASLLNGEFAGRQVLYSSGTLSSAQGGIYFDTSELPNGVYVESNGGAVYYRQGSSFGEPVGDYTGGSPGIIGHAEGISVANNPDGSTPNTFTPRVNQPGAQPGGNGPGGVGSSPGGGGGCPGGNCPPGSGGGGLGGGSGSGGSGGGGSGGSGGQQGAQGSQMQQIAQALQQFTQQLASLGKQQSQENNEQPGFPSEGFGAPENLITSSSEQCVIDGANGFDPTTCPGGNCYACGGYRFTSTVQNS